MGDDDFILTKGWSGRTSGFRSGMSVFGYSHRSNAIAVTAYGSHRSAAALRPGERMGPHKQVAERARMAKVGFSGQKTFWYGQWANGGKGLKNGYLGLKFRLNGGIHYGWARVSVTVKGDRFNTATLTGYAFETIPNKPIVIGKTHGPDVIVRPATLGDLAAGQK
jgi:hypothetical protein